MDFVLEALTFSSENIFFRILPQKNTPENGGLLPVYLHTSHLFSTFAGAFEEQRMEAPNGAFYAGKRDEWGHQTKSSAHDN